MNLDELPGLLENRTDLEKLELDLAAMHALPVSTPLTNELQQRVQEAHRDLEMARAAHIVLYFRLCHLSSLERIAAREELIQRIGTGELKFFDPQNGKWIKASQLLVDSNLRDEELSLREAGQRRLEQALKSAAEATSPLSTLYELILQVEELENRQELSPHRRAILLQARQVYEDGKKRHRELTLWIASGTLSERYRAIGEIRAILANGETQILEAPSEMWRPAAQILEEAIKSYEQESGRAAAEILVKVGELKKNDPLRALQFFYLSLDKAIPFTQSDRQRLETSYLALLHVYGQPTASTPEGQPKVSSEDMEGYQIVAERNQQRLMDLYHYSSEWLNHFLNSALTQTPAKLLREAFDKTTAVDRTEILINMAVTIARKQLNISIEIPEVLVRGAGILFDKGQVEKACALLAQAKPLYTLERADKIHRHAVTCWLAGCLDYYQGRRLSGYKEWKEARDLFQKLAVKARRVKQNERVEWYMARLGEIDTQEVQTYEEVYFHWMNQVDPIALTGSLAEYRKMMDGQFGRKQYSELHKTIEMLLIDGQSDYAPEVRWTTLIEASFFEYQMGDYSEAITHLDEARVGFHQGHRHAVTLWMSGLIRWWLPSQRFLAVQNWEESILEYKLLAERANKANKQGVRAWYENKSLLMTTALRQWIALTRP